MFVPIPYLLSLLTSGAVSELATQSHVADVLYKESHSRNYFKIVYVRISIGTVDAGLI